MTTKSGTRTLAKRGKLDISVLLQEGVIAHLTCGRWRAEERIVLEDLCLEEIESEDLTDYLRLGRKTLIAPEIQRTLNSIETSARYAVKRHSLDTPFGMFVPAAAYPALEQEMDKFQKRWLEWRNRLANHIKAHEDDISTAYQRLALDILKMMKRSRMSAEKKHQFASEYAKRIIKAMPTATQVFNSFHFSFQVSKVPTPEILVDSIKESIVKDAKVQQKITTAQRKEQQVREMNTRILARFERDKEQLVDQLLNGMNKQIREKIFNAVSTALATVKKDRSKEPTLKGRTVMQLQTMVKSFRMLNVLNDVEVEREVAKLEAELKKGKTKRSTESIKIMLAEIKDITSHQLLDMAYTARSARGEIVADHETITEGMGLPTNLRISSAPDLAEDIA